MPAFAPTNTSSPFSPHHVRQTPCAPETEEGAAIVLCGLRDRRGLSRTNTLQQPAHEQPRVCIGQSPPQDCRTPRRPKRLCPALRGHCLTLDHCRRSRKLPSAFAVESGGCAPAYGRSQTVRCPNSRYGASQNHTCPQATSCSRNPHGALCHARGYTWSSAAAGMRSQSHTIRIFRRTPYLGRLLPNTQGYQRQPAACLSSETPSNSQVCLFSQMPEFRNVPPPTSGEGEPAKSTGRLAH
mmetsp:Transcript_24463/g.59335  ORF Transcript_24463/g.59335 Transcript_24463/m.59335 type:complete len:240 (-) Transcript_24463:714-1433(-)